MYNIDVAATGFLYFYDDILSLDTGNVYCYYDFSVQSGNQIPNPNWAISGINGTINNSGGFYQVSGSGAFDGTKYISLNSTLNLSNWTIFLSYERAVSGRDEILFSTFTGTSFINSSGFLLGINPANKLYFQYWNSVDGPQIFTFSEIISSKNLVSVTKNDSSLFFNYYNANQKNSLIEQNLFYKGNFINSNTWFIGGMPSQPYSVIADNFSGYIDDVILIGTDLDQDYQQILFSGLFATQNPSGIINVDNGNNVYQNTASLSDIQDLLNYNTVQTGVEYDLDGNAIPIYIASGVSGNVTITSGTNSEILIDDNDDYNDYTNNGFLIDSGFLFSLGFNRIAILSGIDTTTLVEAYVVANVFENSCYNKFPKYNYVQQCFSLDQSYSTGQLSVFLDGLLQLESGYTATVSGYSYSYTTVGDFFTSGRYFYPPNVYNSYDTILYDYVSGQLNSEFFTGIQSGQSFSNISDLNNCLIFINGVKLVSGQDYILPNISNIDVSFGNNTLSVLTLSGNIYYNSGETGTVDFTNKFLKDTSQVYISGLRLAISGDYVEACTLDYLDGDFIELTYNSGIYDNSDNFFNQ